MEATMRSIGLETSTHEDEVNLRSLEEIATHLRMAYPHDPSKSERFVAIIKHMTEISHKAAVILNGGSADQVIQSSFY